MTAHVSGSSSVTSGAAADDIVLEIPATVKVIHVWGVYDMPELPPDLFTVSIHSDASGLPGTALYTERNVFSTRTPDILPRGFEHRLELYNPPVLAPGTYWLEITNDSPGSDSTWLWITGASTPKSGAYLATAPEVPGVNWMTASTLEHLSLQVEVEFPCNVDCQAELVTDPTLADIGGAPDMGPVVGSATEYFDVALDCSGALVNGFGVIVIRTGKAVTPVNSPWGLLHQSGQKLDRKSALHGQGVVSWGVQVAPPSPGLAGFEYTVQGFCGGFSPSGRTSNAIMQTIRFAPIQ